MDIDYERIGKRIAVLRRTKGLTQAQLAEKADITNNFLSHIGRSYSIPSLETLLKICDAPDCSPDAILVGVKQEPLGITPHKNCSLPPIKAGGSSFLFPLSDAEQSRNYLASTLAMCSISSSTLLE